MNESVKPKTRTSRSHRRYPSHRDKSSPPIHMKLTSMINLMRLQLWERSLRKLRCQTWRSYTTWTWKTWSLNIIRMMCLESEVGSLYLHRFEMIYSLCDSNLWQLSGCDLYCNIVSSLWYIKVLFIGNVAHNQDDFWRKKYLVNFM
jgi:hypothetical protein